MATATEARISDLWNERKLIGGELRDNYEDRWYENWQWYRNKKHTQRLRGQPWMDDTMRPDAFRVVETMVPQHVLNMYRNPRWFSVEANSVAGETYQEIVRSLLLHGWRKADGYRKTIEGVKMGTILGTFVAKVTWQTELGEREVTDLAYEFTADGEAVPTGFQRRTVPDVRHNGPQITFPSLFDLWMDPTGQGRWVVERMSKSLAELKRDNKDFGGSLYKNLGQVEAATALHTHTRSTDDESVHEVVDGIPEYRDADSVELWQCWGYVPPEVRRYDDTQWRLQVIANGDTVIRDVAAPTADHRPPYVAVQSIPIPGQLYGESVLSYVGPLIDRRSQIENMRYNEVLLNIFGQYIIDGRFQIRGQDMFKSPGGAMRVTPTEPGLDSRYAVQQLRGQSVNPDAYSESGMILRDMLDVSGATEPFQGTSFGGRTTATEVNMIANLGTSRFSLATMWMDESFKKPVLERMFALYQSRLTTPEVVQLAGEPDVQGEVDFSDLAYNVDIHVDSGLFGSMDQNQLNSMLNLYYTIVSNPATARSSRWQPQELVAVRTEGSLDGLRWDVEMADQYKSLANHKGFVHMYSWLRENRNHLMEAVVYTAEDDRIDSLRGAIGILDRLIALPDEMLRNGAEAEQADWLRENVVPDFGEEADA